MSIWEFALKRKCQKQSAAEPRMIAYARGPLQPLLDDRRKVDSPEYLQEVGLIASSKVQIFIDSEKAEILTSIDHWIMGTRKVADRCAY